VPALEIKKYSPSTVAIKSSINSKVLSTLRARAISSLENG
jgi:hypothetical protein